MPRFVRPAWIEVVGDSASAARGSGPRTKDGNLHARLTLRTPGGDVSPEIGLSAGGNPAWAELRIPAGFRVEIDGEVVYENGASTLRIRIDPE